MKIRGQVVYSHEDRIKNLSVKNKNTGCWEWTGTLRKGYGRLIIGSRTEKTRKSVSAHRLSYETFNGKITDGMFVCHKCDNPSCVNPEHLFLGTRQDNVNDREAKNRNNHALGESVGSSKLTKNDVKEAIKMRNNGKTYQSIANYFSVHKKTIMNIIKQKTWSHINKKPDAPEQR